MIDVEAVKTLEKILSLWPQASEASEASLRSRLAGHVSDSLSLRSVFAFAPASVRIASPMLLRPGFAKCLVIVTKDNTELLHLVELQLIHEQWVLAAFELECPMCFGSGVDNGHVCDLCFGVGWGTH